MDRRYDISRNTIFYFEHESLDSRLWEVTEEEVSVPSTPPSLPSSCTDSVDPLKQFTMTEGRVYLCSKNQEESKNQKDKKRIKKTVQRISEWRRGIQNECLKEEEVTDTKSRGTLVDNGYKFLIKSSVKEDIWEGLETRPVLEKW